MFLKIIFNIYLILFTIIGILASLLGIYGFITSFSDNTPYKNWYLMILLPLGGLGILVTSGVSLYQYFKKVETFRLTLIPLSFWGLTILVLLITLIVNILDWYNRRFDTDLDTKLLFLVNKRKMMNNLRASSNK